MADIAYVASYQNNSRTKKSTVCTYLWGCYGATKLEDMSRHKASRKGVAVPTIAETEDVPGSPRRPACKLLLTLFCESKGSIIEPYIPRAFIAIRYTYWNLLQNNCPYVKTSR